MEEHGKKAFREAEKELEQESIEKLKDVIKKTLERIKVVEKEVKKLEEEKRLLKLDIEDLKDGRLDRIEERQKKDKRAEQVSLIKVDKVIDKVVHNHCYTNWYQPYHIEVKPFEFPTITTTWCGSSSSSSTYGFLLDSSTAKQNAIGTYLLSSHDIVHLR